MIKWHRFERDVPSLLDKPKAPENNYRDGILPLNMAPRKDDIYDRFPEEKREEITETNLEKEEIIEKKEEEKPKKGRKPLDKNKKNP